MTSNAPAPADSASEGDVSKEDHCFTLHIVSPSPGVPSPLSFFLTPITFTVENLKERIKTTIEGQPSYHTQRLIHRGRLLARDGETMLEIFGREALLSGEAQTLHLVLRDPQMTAAPSIPATVIPQLNHNQPGMVGALPAQSTPNSAEQQNPSQTENAIPAAHPHFNVPAATRAATLLPQVIAQYQQTVNDHQLQLLHNQNDNLQNQRHAYMQRLQDLQSQMMRLQNDLLTQHQNFRNIGSELHRNNSNNPSPFPGGHLPHRTVVPQQAPLPANTQPLPHNLPHRHTPLAGNIVEPHRHFSPFVPPTHLPPHIHAQDSPSRIFRQEGVLPNGDRWHMVVNETVTTIPTNIAQAQVARASPAPQNQLARDVQSIIRHNDLLMRGRQGLQPSAPASAPMSRQGSQNPGSGSGAPVSTSLPAWQIPVVNLAPNHTMNTDSPSAATEPASTPVTTSVPVAVPTVAAPSNHANSRILTPVSGQAASPVVYLLSSSSGPRALLMTGTDSFYSPRLSAIRRNPSVLGPEMQSRSETLLNQTSPRGPPNTGVRYMGPVQRGRTFPPEPRPAANPDAPQEGRRVLNPPNPALNPPANPPVANARANAGIGGQLLPHFWLLIRLGAFVWFFLSGDSSWYRWITLISVAAAIFLFNVGIFNGIAEQVWGPARRHLDGLLPLAPPALPPVAPRLGNNPANGEAPEVPGAPRERREEPTPEQIAARLLQQRRRDDQSWLMVQMRRVEHALLLFMASLVPGVGERHIMARLEQEGAQLEAQRAAREEAERAAAAAAATAAVPAEAAAPEPIEEAVEAVEVGGQVESASTSALEDDTQLRQRHVAVEPMA